MSKTSTGVTKFYFAETPVSLGVFVNNAFGKTYYEARGPGSRGWVQRYLGVPRMYGARLRYSF